MSDVTGGPTFDGSSSTEIWEHLTAILDHFGAAGMFQVANAAALPSSGNWAGRLLSVADTGAIYRAVDATTWELIYLPWTAYTPTPTNASGGTLTGRYMRIGKTVHAHIRHVSPTVTGQPSYTLPVEAVDSNTVWFPGAALARDNSPATEFQVICRKNSSTSVAPYVTYIAGTYVQFDNVSSTKPMTWAANDFLDMQFSYEAN